MRVLVVTNPRATATSPRERDVLARALSSAATEVVVEETANRGHAAALACRAMRDGTDVVVAMGGDGTINEVVNGLLTDGIHDRVPALGIVPGGSTNVVARALGLPNQPIEATATLLDGLRKGTRRTISLGQVDDRWFLFGTGIGFDAAIVERVERQRRRGKPATNLLYATHGVREFFAGARRHPRLHVDLPDGTRLDDIHFAIVTNTNPWTYVGSTPLNPTPGVSFDTDLSIYARRRMGVAGLLVGMARMAGSRPKVGARGAHLVHDLDSVWVSADEPMPVEVDGDYWELREKVGIRSVRNALSVVI